MSVASCWAHLPLELVISVCEWAARAELVAAAALSTLCTAARAAMRPILLDTIVLDSASRLAAFQRTARADAPGHLAAHVRCLSVSSVAYDSFRRWNGGAAAAVREIAHECRNARVLVAPYIVLQVLLLASTLHPAHLCVTFGPLPGPELAWSAGTPLFASLTTLALLDTYYIWAPHWQVVASDALPNLTHFAVKHIVMYGSSATDATELVRRLKSITASPNLTRLIVYYAGNPDTMKEYAGRTDNQRVASLLHALADPRIFVAPELSISAMPLGSTYDCLWNSAVQAFGLDFNHASGFGLTTSEDDTH